LDGVNVISRFDPGPPGRVWVDNTAFEHSVLVPWQGAVVAWPALHTGDLTLAHFEQIAVLKPEVVIFGSGPHLRFVSPGLMRNLMAQRIGVETMDSGAACRTYNVLASEGRKVLAALLLAAA
jgi:uncharacterized protein